MIMEKDNLLMVYGTLLLCGFSADAERTCTQTDPQTDPRTTGHMFLGILNILKPIFSSTIPIRI